MEEKNYDIENKVALPWQFSTTGLIVGYFLGIIPFIIALIGNHQMKNGYDASELKTVYNICIIIMAVLLGIILFFILIMFILALATFA